MSVNTCYTSVSSGKHGSQSAPLLITVLKNSRNRSLEQLAKEINEAKPQTMTQHELADLIFQTCDYADISHYLDALLTDSSFELCPLDKVRKAILEDKKHLMNNDSFLSMLKNYGLENDQEKLQICYDLAFRIAHPYIFRLSETPVPVSDYTLNFSWINLNPQNRSLNLAQNIFDKGLNELENEVSIKDPQELRELEKKEQSLAPDVLEKWNLTKKTFCYRLSKWADKNPGARIHLWFDSALVTQRALQNTFKMMQAISYSRKVDLKLKDIRADFDSYPSRIEDSFHPGTPVYFRVDLLKALIPDILNSSENENSAKYCVVTDVDVEPMGSKELFDQRTINYLSSDGYIFNRVGGRMENSFFIFNKEKRDFYKLHKKYILNDVIKKIRDLSNLRDTFSFNNSLSRAKQALLDSQSVFASYKSLIKELKENFPIAPRKPVKCPPSQFYTSAPNEHHTSEIFRFIGQDPIPYSMLGRNKNEIESHLECFESWKSETLLVPEEK